MAKKANMNLRFFEHVMGLIRASGTFVSRAWLLVLQAEKGWNDEGGGGYCGYSGSSHVIVRTRQTGRRGLPGMCVVV